MSEERSGDREVLELELVAEGDEAPSGDAVPEEKDAIAALLELVQQKPDEAPIDVPARIAGIVVGRVTRVEGGATVAWAGALEGAPVRSLVPLDASHVGRDVALMFEGQDATRPIITGVIEPWSLPNGATVEVKEGKQRVVVAAPDELVLRCGKASITLTKAGKILIRGAYVSSIASGTNRVRGGIVEIN